MFKRKKTKEQKKYISFTTVLLTTVGMVVGVGIFLRNDGLMKTTGSAVASIIAWVFIGILAFMMAISFIEIGSSTKETGGNLATWANKFLKPWMGRAAAIFLIFLIMPIYAVALSVIGANFLFLSFGLFNGGAGVGKSLVDSAPRLWATFALSATFISILFASNILSRKPGEKYIQIAGILKFLPLIVVFLFGTIYAITNVVSSGESTWAQGGVPSTSIIDPVKNQGAKLAETGGMFIAIMMATPAVMFTMDGFIHAANLQGKVKNNKTYVKALVIGMLMILGTYLLVATASYASGSSQLYIPNTTKGWGSFWGDYKESAAFRTLVDSLAAFLKLPKGWTQSQFETAVNAKFAMGGWVQFTGNGYGFGVEGVIRSIFGSVLPLISVLLLLIFVSATGISNAYWFVGPKAGEVMSSENNLAIEIRGENKKGNPKKAGIFFSIIAYSWFIVLWLIEIIFYYTGINSKVHITDIFDASTDALVVEMFFMYALIIAGGIVNRWKMKRGKPHVKVEKNKFFIWTSYPSVVIAIVAPIIGVYGHFKEGNLVAWLIVIYFLLWIALSALHEFYWRKINKKEAVPIEKEIKAEVKEVPVVGATKMISENKVEAYKSKT